MRLRDVAWCRPPVQATQTANRQKKQIWNINVAWIYWGPTSLPHGQSQLLTARSCRLQNEMIWDAQHFLACPAHLLRKKKKLCACWIFSVSIWEAWYSDLLWANGCFHILSMHEPLSPVFVTRLEVTHQFVCVNTCIFIPFLFMFSNIYMGLNCVLSAVWIEAALFGPHHSHIPLIHPISTHRCALLRPDKARPGHCWPKCRRGRQTQK